MIFVDGGEYDEFLQTDAGVFWIACTIQLDGTCVHLWDVSIYPAAGTPTVAGVRAMLQIARTVRSLIESEGKVLCSVNGTRVGGVRTGRNVRIVRRKP